jgi:uncharacterized protein (TIGR03437 family)
LSGRVAPGELISIYGLHIGPVAPAYASFDADGFLPTTLGGVRVTINGIPAPLLYASDAQINAITPVELTAGSSVELQFAQNSVALPNFRVMVDIAAPGVFLFPDGEAAALNQDGTVNSQANPAAAGSYVSVWATGTGYFPGSDGQIATGANQFCSASGNCEILNIAAGSGSVNISYIGAAPDLVNGVVQVNFQICAGCSYSLSVDGINSTIFGVHTSP